MNKVAVKVGEKFLGYRGELVDSFASARRFASKDDALWALPLVYLDSFQFVCGECGELPCKGLIK